MQTHVKVVAVLFLVLGGLLTLGAVFSSALFGLLAAAVGRSQEEGAPIGAAILGSTGVALAVFLLLFSIPSLLCGWGLLSYRRWARVTAIVLAAVSLTGVPVGTIFGVYVLWVMFSKRSEGLFEAGEHISAGHRP